MSTPQGGIFRFSDVMNRHRRGGGSKGSYQNNTQNLITIRNANISISTYISLYFYAILAGDTDSLPSSSCAIYSKS
jgi:hypothetical protein